MNINSDLWVVQLGYEKVGAGPSLPKEMVLINWLKVWSDTPSKNSKEYRENWRTFWAQVVVVAAAVLEETRHSLYILSVQTIENCWDRARLMLCLT